MMTSSGLSWNPKVSTALLVWLLLLLLQVGTSPVSSSFFPEEEEESFTITRCGIESNKNWVSWYGSVETDHPIVYPKTEEELRSIVTAARDGGCKVRPVGTGHSYDGIVAQKTEENIIIVNLADYITDVPDAWHKQFDEENMVVRFAAGRSLLEFQMFLRENGVLLPTFTGGPLFSLGGVFFSPSVHGHSFGEDRLTFLMTGLLAMKSDGTIVEIIDPDQVKDWRGSMGLLGIGLAVEIRVQRNRGQRMEAHTETFKPIFRSWNEENVMSSIRAFADGKDSLALTHFAASTFNLFTDRINLYTTVIDGDPIDVESSLDEYRRVWENAGGTEFAKTGGPKNIVPRFYNRLLYELGTSFLSVFGVSDDEVVKNRDTVRDGYVHEAGTPSIVGDEIQMYMPCPDDCLEDGWIFKVFDLTRDFIGREGSLEFPNYATTIRMIDVASESDYGGTRTMTLENLERGRRYISLQHFQTGYPDETDQPASDKLMRLQKELDQFVIDNRDRTGGSTYGGGGFHIGKNWGYGKLGDLDGAHPFQDDAIADRFYDQSTKDTFLALMQTHDPDGVFAAGEALRLLGMTPNPAKFDRRRFSEENTVATSSDCSEQSDADCLSGCCRREESLLIFVSEQCTASGRTIPLDGDCSLDCECATDDLECRNGQCQERPSDRGGFPTCFSGAAQVQVLKEEGDEDNQNNNRINDEEKGEWRTMDQLRIGDQVHVGKNVYEPVYSFGHYDPNSTAVYLRISVTPSLSASPSPSSWPPPLEVSPYHMVYVLRNSSHDSIADGGGDFVPAAALRMGDALLLLMTTTTSGGRLGSLDHRARNKELQEEEEEEDGLMMPVTIESITRIDTRGVFAPMTPSGRIVVNGLLASTYVSFHQERLSERCIIPGVLSISHHWLAHVAMFPHRLAHHYLFSFSLVAAGGGDGEEHEDRNKEQYDANGLSTFWVSPLLKYTHWGAEQSEEMKHVLLLFVGLPILVVFSITEHLVLLFMMESIRHSLFQAASLLCGLLLLILLGCHFLAMKIRSSRPILSLFPV